MENKDDSYISNGGKIIDIHRANPIGKRVPTYFSPAPRPFDTEAYKDDSIAAGIAREVTSGVPVYRSPYPTIDPNDDSFSRIHGDSGAASYEQLCKNAISGDPVNAKRTTRRVNKLLMLAIALLFAGCISQTHAAKEVGASLLRYPDNPILNCLAAETSDRYGIRVHITENHMGHYPEAEYSVQDIDKLVTPMTLYLRKLADGDTQACLNSLDSAVHDGVFLGDPESTRTALSDDWNQTRHGVADSARKLGDKLGRQATAEDLLSNSLQDELQKVNVQVATGLYMTYQDYCDHMLDSGQQTQVKGR